MPKFRAKIIPFLSAAAIFLSPLAVAAELPAELLTGAMANFTPSKPAVPAPEIAFVDLDGKEMSLQAFRGKVVLLNFWATWCAPCRREMPDLDALQARFGGPDFAVLALSLDRKGPEAVPPFFAEVGVERLEVYNDRTMKSMRAFLAPGLPTTVLLDRHGKQLGRLIGPAEWASPEAIALIEHVLKQVGDDKPLLETKAGG